MLIGFGLLAIALVLAASGDRAKLRQFLGKYPNGASNVNFTCDTVPGIRHVRVKLKATIGEQDYAAFMIALGAKPSTEVVSQLGTEGQPVWFDVPTPEKQTRRFVLHKQNQRQTLFIQSTWSSGTMYLEKDGAYGRWVGD